jgi:hypothetical protein
MLEWSCVFESNLQVSAVFKQLFLTVNLAVRIVNAGSERILTVIA